MYRFLLLYVGCYYVSVVCVDFVIGFLYSESAIKWRNVGISQNRFFRYVFLEYVQFLFGASACVCRMVRMVLLFVKCLNSTMQFLEFDYHIVDLFISYRYF